jgi:hypothetical protein
MKSGNLNFLKPSGPLQACNGTALPKLTRVCFGCWNAINFHQDVYRGLTVLNVILVFGWFGEEIARKMLPGL